MCSWKVGIFIRVPHSEIFLFSRYYAEYIELHADYMSEESDLNHDKVETAAGRARDW